MSQSVRPTKCSLCLLSNYKPTVAEVEAWSRFLHLAFKEESCLIYPLTKDCEVEDALNCYCFLILQISFLNKIMSAECDVFEKVLLTFLIYTNINIFLFQKELYRFFLKI